MTRRRLQNIIHKPEKIGIHFAMANRSKAIKSLPVLSSHFSPRFPRTEVLRNSVGKYDNIRSELLNFLPHLLL